MLVYEKSVLQHCVVLTLCLLCVGLWLKLLSSYNWSRPCKVSLHSIVSYDFSLCINLSGICSLVVPLNAAYKDC